MELRMNLRRCAPDAPMAVEPDFSGGVGPCRCGGRFRVNGIDWVHGRLPDELAEVERRRRVLASRGSAEAAMSAEIRAQWHEALDRHILRAVTGHLASAGGYDPRIPMHPNVLRTLEES